MAEAELCLWKLRLWSNIDSPTLFVLWRVRSLACTHRDRDCDQLISRLSKHEIRAWRY
jgi:hypothetical protein